MPKIAIIIVSYNGKKYLEPLFKSLAVQTYPKEKLFIIVVDNASTDGSLAYLKGRSDIILIENKNNEGFAGGNNIGIKKAMEIGADYIYLLNQDTEVVPDFLEAAVTVAEKNSDAGSVQSLLILHPETNQVNSAGNLIHYLGFGFCGKYRADAEITYVNLKKSGNVVPITYGSGAGCLYKTSVLKEIGLLDEDLFAYHEDLDWGWRIRLAGYKNYLAPDSAVFHKYEFSRSIKKYFWMERNRFIVMLQSYKWKTLFCIFPALFIMEMGLFAYSFINGWWREKLKVYRYFLKKNSWNKILKKRKERQTARKVSDREIVKNFSGKIEFQDVNNPVLKYIANPVFNLYWQICKRIIIW